MMSEGAEMDVDEASKEAAGGGDESNDQDKPTERDSLTQDLSEQKTGENSGSESRCTPCPLTKALKLPTIKEMLESLDQWRRLHGTSEDMASSLEHGLTSLNIRGREDEEREDGFGFCAAISFTDGTVLHTTPSLTSTLGYPGNTFIVSTFQTSTNSENMWVGRSFIDYVMSEDQADFCRQVTDKISVPLCQMSIRSDQAGSEENDQKVEHGWM
jgi:hypothetical protein